MNLTNQTSNYESKKQNKIIIKDLTSKILKGAGIVAGVVAATVAGVLILAAKAKDYSDNEDCSSLDSDSGSTKYKIILDDEEQDEIFDSYDEAEEYALYLCSCDREGAEVLHMSNPGDYDYDEDEYESPDYEIVEVDD